MTYQSWQTKKRSKGKLEYKKFRVRGHIRSFRDLEIYKKTTLLSSQIYEILLPAKLPKKKLLEEELELLRKLSKQVPKMIAEAYGDKFTDKERAYAKLEKAMRYISNVIAKLDFMIAAVEHKDTKQIFVKLISKYQVQRRKILNLKKAWVRIEEKYGKEK